jgi:hypothetical protein
MPSRRGARHVLPRQADKGKRRHPHAGPLVICRDWVSAAASQARSRCRGSQGSWAQGKGVFRDEGMVNNWAAPGTGNGAGAPAGPDARRLGRGWHCAFSSTGSCAVAASAMRGISHTGMEILSNVATPAGDVNRSAWCTPVRTRPGRFHVPLAKGNFDVAAHVRTSWLLHAFGECQVMAQPVATRLLVFH